MTIAPHLRSVFQFVGAVKAHVKVILTSSLLILAVGLAQTFGPTGHSLLYGTAYAAIIVIGLFVAFYRAWNDQRIAKEKALALIEAEKAKAPIRDWNAEWKDVADKFEKRARSGVGAQCTHWSHGNPDFWSLNGSPDVKDDCEQLCRLAGTLLSKSYMRDELSQAAASSLDYLDKWLIYLRDNHHALIDIHCGTEISDNGERNTVTIGRINDVASVSARACIYCASRGL